MATDVTPTLCERGSELPVMLCDQRQWVGWNTGVWTWVALPGGQHCYLLQSIGNCCPRETSQYQTFEHFITDVGCPIQQSTSLLVPHGWDIVRIGSRRKCCMCSAVWVSLWTGEWDNTKNNETIFFFLSKPFPGAKASPWSWRKRVRMKINKPTPC